MTIRLRLAVPLALVACCATLSARAQDNSIVSANEPAPTEIKVDSVKVVEPGQGDPQGTFDVVNLGHGACYAILLSPEERIEVGEHYAVMPATDVDEALRKKIAGDYPKCTIVNVVARVMR